MEHQDGGPQNARHDPMREHPDGAVHGGGDARQLHEREGVVEEVQPAPEADEERGNAREEERGQHAEGDEVGEALGQEVGQRGVVPVGHLLGVVGVGGWGVGCVREQAGTRAWLVLSYFVLFEAPDLCTS